MRLDKYLSQATGISRKDIRRLMRRDEVSLNGEPVRDPSLHIDPDEDEICLYDQPVGAPGPRYLMLYKPEGYVSASDDPTHPTVNSLVDLPRAEELHCCGRLDIDATGLVLLTDDGQWSHRITSPRHKLSKRYRVETADPIDDDAIRAFDQGLKLNGELRRTLPARLQILSPREALVELTEGRYHQVKRMFAALGNRVVTLHRERIGSIDLDPELEPGDYRPLTESEIDSIYS
ncbi:pseudouridine synthase [Marinobacterium nitratireducens]|uniref:Pseudouridine synthase n=1 Tax=Marinobacterium nitratireducens TaxID=518897 RepID=A0A917ZRD7_9GAMM|nr:16S rRNA pseudouridine(516) synthase RsuA [Marinobacterium nitratireducens]GGO88602.1 pseudouridine synthase [Marinobacterium nitratireducens]